MVLRNYRNHQLGYCCFSDRYSTNYRILERWNLNGYHDVLLRRPIYLRSYYTRQVISLLIYVNWLSASDTWAGQSSIHLRTHCITIDSCEILMDSMEYRLDLERLARHGDVPTFNDGG